MKPEGRRGFVTTRWSLVVAAGVRTEASEQALATLCQTYWYALYAYVRRCGHDIEQAEDLVQGFFLRLLDREMLQRAQPERGRFRSFLLGSLKHFMINEYERVTSLGGRDVEGQWRGAAASLGGTCPLVFVHHEMLQRGKQERSEPAALWLRALQHLTVEQAEEEPLHEVLGLLDVVPRSSDVGVEGIPIRLAQRRKRLF